MKKPYIQFLSISFLISYVSFGAIIYSKLSFDDIFLNPLYVSLFVIGFLGPFISTLLVHIINKETLGEAKGFINQFKTFGNKKAIYLIPLFLMAHYGFLMILNNIYAFGNLSKIIYYLPISFILLGSQEIGWRLMLQPALEENKGYWKSVISTGLFWSLWFLPLLFIPGFIILPQFYLHFAIYLIGVSFLLTGIYKASGSILYTILLSTLIFSFYPIIILKQSFILLALAILEAILSNIYKDKVGISLLK